MNETLREAHWPTLVFEDGEAGDLCRCSCGKQGFDYKQGREWFAEHLAALASEAAPAEQPEIEQSIRAIYSSRAGLRDDEPIWSDKAVGVLLAALDAARRASTATPPEPGLDVERLAIKAAARLEGEVSRLRTELAACSEAHARLSASPIPEAD